MSLDVVILAAGKSTRFASRLPKVLHLLGERPLVAYAVELAMQFTATPPVVIVSPESADAIRAWGGERVRYVVQPEPRGTGHAVRQARALLEGQAEHVLVLYADMPLVQEATLRHLVERHLTRQAAATLLTVTGEVTHGCGRLVREAIVEGAEATPDSATIHEQSSGSGVFAAAVLWEFLEQLQAGPRKGEYSLTDIVAPVAATGQTVETLTVTDPTEAIDINTRVDLALAEAVLRQRINARWMLAGVTLVDPASTYIGPNVTIGQDTVIQPNTHLRGTTTIGTGCTIGPNSLITGSTIGDRCVVLASVLEYAVMEEDSNIGPFSHLRQGARVCHGAHVGNFGEMKNSTLGPHAKMGHFSYLGDAQVGEDVNIGAGTITCNFDGERKHPTVIEEGTFIGSDSLLIAPVHIGAGAKTGAGSVVTHDIPARTVVYGVPARVHKQLDAEPTESKSDQE
ncbi:MAG TPA: bifunctional UDP-N-acetylglucosamine diphosphorylase/glucosamine-1-phosphate N-acetyltransferase GlmU [Anaerolineae bacterium]|nr:bifunctional UDP-N-acetylglucosamine diphosphorylase/glucosamine-1-phosphate N-acetyltransferase GlmU [Anaerolineae bacterium]HQH39506.1 bifunctional UDP-N-acetylglucosamine diphosphorylase/glucosamine-1-phosphate N-acetyltransferase GlmU [Anaerolineae bacterium]